MTIEEELAGIRLALEQLADRAPGPAVGSVTFGHPASPFDQPPPEVLGGGAAPLTLVPPEEAWPASEVGNEELVQVLQRELATAREEIARQRQRTEDIAVSTAVTDADLRRQLRKAQEDLDLDSSVVEAELRRQLARANEERDTARSELTQALADLQPPDPLPDAPDVDLEPAPDPDEERAARRREAGLQRLAGWGFDITGDAGEGKVSVPNEWLVGTGPGFRIGQGNGERFSFSVRPDLLLEGGGVTAKHALLLAGWLAVMADPMGDAFAIVLEEIRGS